MTCYSQIGTNLEFHEQHDIVNYIINGIVNDFIKDMSLTNINDI